MLKQSSNDSAHVQHILCYKMSSKGGTVCLYSKLGHLFRHGIIIHFHIYYLQFERLESVSQQEKIWYVVDTNFRPQQIALMFLINGYQLSLTWSIFDDSEVQLVRQKPKSTITSNIEINNYLLKMMKGKEVEHFYTVNVCLFIKNVTHLLLS